MRWGSAAAMQEGSIVGRHAGRKGSRRHRAQH